MTSQQDAMVVTCKVTECSYNKEEMCAAPEIRVGGPHPECDTFTPSEGSVGGQQEARVCSCSVSRCTFYADARCEAPGVTVGRHADHADCLSYRN